MGIENGDELKLVLRDGTGRVERGNFTEQRFRWPAISFFLGPVGTYRAGTARYLSPHQFQVTNGVPALQNPRVSLR